MAPIETTRRPTQYLRELEWTDPSRIKTMKRKYGVNVEILAIVRQLRERPGDWARVAHVPHGSLNTFGGYLAALGCEADANKAQLRTTSTHAAPSRPIITTRPEQRPRVTFRRCDP